MSTLRPFIGNAEEFPILTRWQYFNHAGVSPWPMRTIRAVQTFSERFGVDCFQSENWDSLLGELRSQLAAMINADYEEIALIRNTGDAISQIAGGLDWRSGDVIVMPACEYPSNIYPWMDAARRYGCRIEMVPERISPQGVARVDEEELIAACQTHGAKLLAISHVQWGSGQKMDIERLGQFCRGSGVLFAVDVIQSLGVIPVDVRGSQIDFLFAGGHKWLMSPPGAGVLFCRRELIDRVQPPAVGWLSVVNPYKWETNFTLQPSAGRFESGTHAYACLMGLKSSVGLLGEIGVEEIFRHVRSLGDRFSAGIVEAGYTLVSPRGAASSSGAVSFNHPTIAAEEIVKSLRQSHRIELAARCGRLRFAPHFYNSSEQVDYVLKHLPKLE